jgi:hypothetical protein
MSRSKLPDDFTTDEPAAAVLPPQGPPQGALPLVRARLPVPDPGPPVVILLAPASMGTRGVLYDASLPDGESLCRSRTPFFAAARVLRSRGMDEATWFIARHVGSNIDAMRCRLGFAARWTISELATGGIHRVIWQAYDFGKVTDNDD